MKVIFVFEGVELLFCYDLYHSNTLETINQIDLSIYNYFNCTAPPHIIKNVSVLVCLPPGVDAVVVQGGRWCSRGCCRWRRSSVLVCAAGSIYGY